MWNAQTWVGDPGQEDLSGNNCVSCWWPQPPPCDPCSSSQISSWYWACQLLMRASPGPGILWGWVQVRHLILRSFCCNSISASNFHALLPSYLPPSGLCWGKGDRGLPAMPLRAPWKSLGLTPPLGILSWKRSIDLGREGLLFPLKEQGLGIQRPGGGSWFHLLGCLAMESKAVQVLPASR